MDAGVVSGLLQFVTQERFFRKDSVALERHCAQKASHRKRLRRRNATHTLLQQPASETVQSAA
jgi:hypothetical protein